MPPKNYSLVEQLSSILACTPQELYGKLCTPKGRQQAVNFLQLVTISTIHLKNNFRVKFAGLTYSNARDLMAYGGFKHITVDQHYYERHRMYLTHSELPCLIRVPNPEKNHQEFFPLEVLRVVLKDDENDEDHKVYLLNTKFAALMSEKEDQELKAQENEENGKEEDMKDEEELATTSADEGYLSAGEILEKDI